MDMRDQKSMPQITHLLYLLLKLQKKLKCRYERLEMCDSNNSLVVLVVEILVAMFFEVLDVISKVLMIETRTFFFKVRSIFKYSITITNN